jgi:hypothetical protein
MNYNFIFQQPSTSLSIVVYGPIGENRFWWHLWCCRRSIVMFQQCVVYYPIQWHFVIILMFWCDAINSDHYSYFQDFYNEHFADFQWPFHSSEKTVLPKTTDHSAAFQCDVFKTSRLCINSSWHLIFTMDNIVCIMDSFTKVFYFIHYYLLHYLLGYFSMFSILVPV